METKSSDCYDGIQPVLSTFNIAVDIKMSEALRFRCAFTTKFITVSDRIQVQHTACEAVRRSLEFAAWKESSESNS